MPGLNARTSEQIRMKIYKQNSLAMLFMYLKRFFSKSLIKLEIWFQGIIYKKDVLSIRS